jgi:hypothetical protein
MLPRRGAERPPQNPGVNSMLSFEHSTNTKNNPSLAQKCMPCPEPGSEVPGNWWKTLGTHGGVATKQVWLSLAFGQVLGKGRSANFCARAEALSASRSLDLGAVHRPPATGWGDSSGMGRTARILGGAARSCNNLAQ